MPESTPEAPRQPDTAETAEAERPLEELLAEAQARADQHREAMLRALADAENARKRAQNEISNAFKFAAERVIESLLPVSDSLEAALAADKADPETLKNGVELTLRQLRAVLEKENVKEIAPGPGEKFDPHRHQAMAAVEADTDPNTVVSVMQKGYSMNDRVIRPALVSVAKARPANDA